MNLVRLPVDDRVDRLDVEALQGVELTSTNKSRACYTTFFVLIKAFSPSWFCCDCSYPLCGSLPPPETVVWKTPVGWVCGMFRVVCPVDVSVVIA